MAALRNAAIGALRSTGITPATAPARWPYSASPDGFAGALSRYQHQYDLAA